MSHLISQKILDKEFVERESYCLPGNLVSVYVILLVTLYFIWLSIIRHNRRYVIINSCLETWQMIFSQTVLSLIYIPLACRVVRIKSVLSRTAAWEVFHGQSHAVRLYTLRAALETYYKSCRDVSDQFWILTKGSVCTLPS